MHSQYCHEVVSESVDGVVKVFKHGAHDLRSAVSKHMYPSPFPISTLGRKAPFQFLNQIGEKKESLQKVLIWSTCTDKFYLIRSVCSVQIIRSWYSNFLVTLD